MLVDGPCRVDGWLECEDTLRSLRAVEKLGVQASWQDGSLWLKPPASEESPSESVTLDCGNSGTTARLLCGVLAGWLPDREGEIILQGDESLSGRPMGRVLVPLEKMGAKIHCLEKQGFLPVAIAGSRLQGTVCDLEVPSAQVKSALLLAALNATGTTSIRGAGSSRDHTERLLSTMGIVIDGFPGSGGLSLTGPSKPRPFHIRVPGDPSSAFFFQVAAAVIPHSRLRILGQSLNPGRCGALAVLQRAGASVSIGPQDDTTSEPVGDVSVSPGGLKGFRLGASEIPTLIDELPVLAVLATQARGETMITGAGDLRVKECDRISAMTRALSLLGAEIEERPDGWRIQGPTNLRGGTEKNPLVLETRADHRIAMALAVAGLVGKGTTVLDDEACVGVSYPNFFKTLNQLLNRS